jgi:hypothetical protein
MTRSSETYRKRKAEGVCVDCGTEAPIPGRVLGVKCRADRRAKSPTLTNARQLSLHLPTGREAPAETAKTRFQRMYRDRVAGGLCVDCGACAPVRFERFCKACQRSRRRRTQTLMQERADQDIGIFCPLRVKPSPAVYVGQIEGRSVDLEVVWDGR